MITIAVNIHSRSPDKKGTFGTERMNKKSNTTLSFKDIQPHVFGIQHSQHTIFETIPISSKTPFFSFPPPKKASTFRNPTASGPNNSIPKKPTNGGSCNEITLIIKSKEAMTPTNVQIQELNQPQRQRSVVGW